MAVAIAEPKSDASAIARAIDGAITRDHFDDTPTEAAKALERLVNAMLASEPYAAMFSHGAVHAFVEMACLRL
jgi:hypothetical protein